MEEVYSRVQYSDTFQMEDEHKIYKTPCEDDGDYGVIYTELPTTVE